MFFAVIVVVYYYCEHSFLALLWSMPPGWWCWWCLFVCYFRDSNVVAVKTHNSINKKDAFARDSQHGNTSAKSRINGTLCSSTVVQVGKIITHWRRRSFEKFGFDENPLTRVAQPTNRSTSVVARQDFIFDTIFLCVDAPSQWKRILVDAWCKCALPAK